MRPLYECKLDKGMRILYLEQRSFIQIRHICKHDLVGVYHYFGRTKDSRTEKCLIV